MNNIPKRLARGLLLILALSLGAAAGATDIGQVKVAKGEVVVERGGASFPAAVGTRLQASDTIRTGADGSAGITMEDDSLLSIGPNSALTLDRYAFDATTRQGQFEASLGKGSLSVISGRIAKQTPDAMKVRTPTSVLGVRGTEFVVSVE